MTREIKFRAYDKIKKEMTELAGFAYPDFCKEGDGKPKFIGLKGGFGGKIEGNACDFELMQYTGLKDKNEKEVYEGDIYVLHSGKSPTSKSIYYKGLVIANETTWLGFDHKEIYSKRQKSYIYSPFGNKICCTVIGNIYQNPELLENDND